MAGICVLLCPETSLHQRLGIRDLDSAGTEDADRLEVLRCEDAAETALPGTVSGVVDQRRERTVLLSVRTTRDNGGTLRAASGVAGTAELGPIALVAADRCPDLLLRFPGVETPEIGCVLERDLAVDDVEPDRALRLAHDGDAVPAGPFQLRGEPASEVGSGEPPDRIALKSDALHLGTTRD